jgi:8-oxo-dGTP diphosphatase
MPKVVSSCKALIKHYNKYLIIKEELRKGDIWDLPGGKIEYGESPEETVHRELNEELGIKVSIIKPIGVWYFFSQHQKDQVICHTFLCEPIGKFVVDTSNNPADEEITEVKWVTYDELINSNEFKLGESLLNLIKKLNN